jgi:hypothetical protein
MYVQVALCGPDSELIYLDVSRTHCMPSKVSSDCIQSSFSYSVYMVHDGISFLTTQWTVKYVSQDNKYTHF